MEAPVPRLPFWMHALFAEAKRRARQRRLLIALLLVVVAAVTAAVVLTPSGGGSRSGLPGAAGGTSASARFFHFGAFVLTVPKGFHLVDPGQSRTSSTLNSFAVADDSRTARAVYTAALPYPANGVGLYMEPYGRAAPGWRLPPDLHKLHRDPLGASGTMWNDIFWGGGGEWDVTVFEGTKASAAERAAVERAFRSIRRAS